jgi:hypothetical protein
MIPATSRTPFQYSLEFASVTPPNLGIPAPPRPAGKRRSAQLFLHNLSNPDPAVVFDMSNGIADAQARVLRRIHMPHRQGRILARQTCRESTIEYHNRATGSANTRIRPLFGMARENCCRGQIGAWLSPLYICRCRMSACPASACFPTK